MKNSFVFKIISIVLCFLLFNSPNAYATCDWTNHDSDVGNTRFVESSCSPGTRLNNSWVFCDVRNGNEETGVLVSGDTVFIKTKDHKIKKLDIATGKETIWLESFKYDAMCGISNNRIVVHLESKGNYYIQCIDTTTKKVYWEKPSCSIIENCLMSDKYFLHHYICRDDSGSELGSSLECIDVKTGKVYWKLRSDSINQMAVEGSYLVHEVNDELQCVDVKSGYPKWTKEKPESCCNSRVLIKGNLVYSVRRISDFENPESEYTYLNVYDLKSGKNKWFKKFNPSPDDCCFSTIEGAVNDEYFFLSNVNKIYCFDRYTGKLEWEYKHSTNIYQPAVTEKHLYFLNAYCTPICIDLSSEKIVSEGKLIRYDRSNQIIIDRDRVGTSEYRAWLSRIHIAEKRLIVNIDFDDLVYCFGGATIIRYVVDEKGYRLNDDPINTDIAPLISENRTYLSARYVTEPLGGEVFWDAAERKVTCKQADKVIELWIDNPVAKVDGKSIQIDKDNTKVTPIIVDDRTMVPMRFLAETFGCDVEWVAETKEIILTYSP